MRRRNFIQGIAASTAWPIAVRAQPAMPAVGFLTFKGPDDSPQLNAVVRQGLKDGGFEEGRNITVEYRFAGDKSENLPALAADLVRRQVAVIVAANTAAALAAKAMTTTIPIVFETGADPVRLGLVASLNKPGGNVTGVTNISIEVAPKRLELLHEFFPAATVMALLVNPAETALAETQLRSVSAAAHNLGLDLRVFDASTERDFDAVFANLAQVRAGGLVVGGGAFLISRQEQLAALVVRHAVPAVGEYREFVAAGGLASYGGSIKDAYRLVGAYAARILKGETPAYLPVQQSTKVELILNLKAAKALGISFPLTLLGRADEVIE